MFFLAKLPNHQTCFERLWKKVFYSIVPKRPWLTEPATLLPTNPLAISLAKTKKKNTNFKVVRCKLQTVKLQTIGLTQQMCKPQIRMHLWIAGFSSNVLHHSLWNLVPKSNDGQLIDANRLLGWSSWSCPNLSISGFSSKTVECTKITVLVAFCLRQSQWSAITCL